MPNWCMNVATFKNKNEAMLARLVEAFNSGNTMNDFWPCPQELRDTHAGSFPAGSPEQVKLDQTQRENMNKYGATDWYDWCCKNWSVKWDFGREHHADAPKAQIEEKDGEQYVKLVFDTAWGPPIGFYAYMHENFGFEVKAYFFEPGMGFAGSSKNGSESVIQIEEMTQEWLEDNMPAKLCDAFNLYEHAAMMEETEKEFREQAQND